MERPLGPTVPTKYWHRVADGRIRCDVCPRFCTLREGQQGLCFVRAREGDAVVLKTYGRSSGFCVDPIEKKPLNHFLPGSSVLSFGTEGCNLVLQVLPELGHQQVAGDREAVRRGVARADRPRGQVARLPERGLHVQRPDDLPRVRDRRREGLPRARHPDGGRHRRLHLRGAAQGPLRAHRRRERGPEGLHREVLLGVTNGHLQPVLDTLVYLKAQTKVWLEITNLVIPGAERFGTGDRRDGAVGGREPGPRRAHALHGLPSRLENARRAPTPPATLVRARQIALEAGVRYAYTGNIDNPEGGGTSCHRCGALLVGRHGYTLTHWALENGACGNCGEPCAGLFEQQPGQWGQRRLPVRLRDFASLQ